MIKPATFLIFLLTFFVSGCIAVKKNADQHLQDSICQLEEQNQQLGLELKRLHQDVTAKQIEIDRLKKLQSKLITKQAKIEQLKLASKQATQQVVRARTILRSHHNKAGIVVHLAEVETELNTLAEKPMDMPQERAVREAERLISMSVAALNKEDFETASSLSNKAQKLLIPFLALQTKKQTRLNINFATPLIMTIKKECNVRKAPGMESTVLFTMKAGSQVKARAFVKNWLNIETATLKKGWIYYRLLTLDQ